MIKIARASLLAVLVRQPRPLALIALQTHPAVGQSANDRLCRATARRHTAPTPTPSPSPTPMPTPTDGGSSGNSINGLANQRFNQMITNQVLGTVLLGVNEQVNCSDCVTAFGSVGSFSAGIHGRKELTPNLSLLAGHRLHPVQRGRLQCDQRADRCLRAALRFRRLGIVAAVLRRRRHRVAVREGALQPELRDESRRRIARQFDQQLQLRRLRPCRLDEPIVAARRDRRLRRNLAAMAAGGAATPIRRRAFNPFDATVATGTDRTNLVKVGGQWTHLFDPSIEGNINGGFVQSFATHSGIVAAVTGDGTMMPTIGNQVWFEYGGRLALPHHQGLGRGCLRQWHRGPAAGRQHHSRRSRTAHQLLGHDPESVKRFSERSCPRQKLKREDIAL